MGRLGWLALLGSLLAGSPSIAQSAAPAEKTQTASSASSKSKTTTKAVKAESVTINMPEGMTRDQANAILEELKAIHQLLSQQTAKAAAAPALAPVNEKVQMKLASGWYAMGREDAPVTLVEFTDYQCPFCLKYHAETFAELKKTYIDTGKVRFISRDMPLDFHPYAEKAAEAARCAGEQNKFWELRETMITNSTDLSPESILKYAQSNGLDMASFRACADTSKFKNEIQKDIADAGTLGISGTPSFVIGKTDKNEIAGVRIVGAVPLNVFEAAIKDAMAAK